MWHSLTAFIAPGGGEMILILLVLILLFGAKDAPRILRNIQNTINKLQRTAADFRYKLMYGDLHANTSEGETFDEDECTEDNRYDDEDPEHDFEIAASPEPEPQPPSDPPPDGDSKVQP